MDAEDVYHSSSSPISTSETSPSPCPTTSDSEGPATPPLPHSPFGAQSLLLRVTPRSLDELFPRGEAPQAGEHYAAAAADDDDDASDYYVDEDVYGFSHADPHEGYYNTDAGFRQRTLTIKREPDSDMPVPDARDRRSPQRTQTGIGGLPALTLSDNLVLIVTARGAAVLVVGVIFAVVVAWILVGGP
ncbi:hypothetical protein BD413DRAFT_526845 [Trametes elegans]|nr:hypothetical protein BD413DRAFT_526845 [Trametes elegans]